jgi:hypothetical protein
VSSVALTAPAIFTVSGSPITSSGTLALTYSGTALPVLNGGTGVTVSTGANSVVLRDANQNITANAFFGGFTSVAASGTQINLTAASTPVYVVTGSGGQVIRLPDATTLPKGPIFSFNNNQSSGAITVNNNSGTLIASVPSGGYTTVVLLDNATTAGSWDRHDQSPANVSWSTNTFDYLGSITSATWNGATIAINRGGTGQTTANTAFNALAPTQTGNNGKFLTTDGTNTSWATNPLGTVTSVAATVPTFLSVTGSPITTSGTLALTLSGTALPTTSGGTGLTSFTANGVVYASSTSALATGSALTFDGTGNFFLTAASGGSEIRSYSSAASTTAALSMRNPDRYWQMSSQAGGNFLLYDTTGSQSTWLVSPGASGYSAWYQNGSEQMRLTSTGLGIGTSSPSAKLTVVSANPTNGYVASFGNSQGSAGRTGTYLLFDATSLADWKIGIPPDVNAFSFYDVVTGAERMRIDASGNLGLGVTPSAWTLGKAVEVGTVGNAIWSAGASNTSFTSNLYYNSSSYKYATSNAASSYQQAGGTHNWYIAPSGTAGNTATLTQAMTLDASGRLGIGTTSPTSKLHINDGTQAIVQLVGSTGQGNWGANASAVYFTTESAIPMLFYTNQTERARIDASGNFLIAQTSAAVPNANCYSFYQTGGYQTIGHISGTASGTFYSWFFYNSTGIGSISQNGTTGVLYNITSDYRLKNNPVALTDSGAFVDALQPKTWDWWDGSGKGVGFIAHEFMEVAKYSGNGEKDAVDAKGKPVYQVIQPSSSEVMANLVAEIQSLRKRLATAGI